MRFVSETSDKTICGYVRAAADQLEAVVDGIRLVYAEVPQRSDDGTEIECLQRYFDSEGRTWEVVAHADNVRDDLGQVWIEVKVHAGYGWASAELVRSYSADMSIISALQVIAEEQVRGGYAEEEKARA